MRNADHERKLAARLAASIKRLRSSRGWSQAALAERLDVSTGYVGMIEREDRLPALPMIWFIAETFGVGIDELVGRPAEGSDRWLEESVAILRTLPEEAKRSATAMLRGLAQSFSSRSEPRRARVSEKSHERVKRVTNPQRK